MAPLVLRMARSRTSCESTPLFFSSRNDEFLRIVLFFAFSIGMNSATNESIASHRLRATADLRLPVWSSSEPTDRYKEFQEALSMLKVSVEQVWRFELEQLHEQGKNSGVDCQVPSIYSCRSVLPMISETIPSIPKKASRSDTPVVGPLPNATPVKTPSSKQIIQFSRQKSTATHFSAGRKSKQLGFGDQVIRYGTKKALLRLKLRCAKHMH